MDECKVLTFQTSSIFLGSRFEKQGLDRYPQRLQHLVMVSGK